MPRPSRLGRARPVQTITSLGGGTGNSGEALVSTGSNGSTEWLSVVQRISADGNAVLGPFVNFAAGSNISLSRDAGPGNSIPSNTIRIHSTGGGGGTPTFVGWRVYASSDVALTNGVETVIPFDTERYDTDTFHSTVTNSQRATVPSGKAGKYHVGFNVRVTNSPGDPSYALIQHVTSGGGTSTVIALQLIDNNASIPSANISTDWDAAVGDYFQCFVFVNAASKNATANAAYSPEFWGHFLG